MSAPHPVVTGPTNGDFFLDKPAPNRLEFREFVKDRRQFSLYVQALQRMQDHEFSNDFSFAAIGGIHGYPFVQWGNSGAPSPPTNKDHFGGYCTHGSVVFPTWHRPYVALYEQELNRQANEVVTQYHGPDVEEWKTAARNLRSPFWDWAYIIANDPVPVEITLSEVDIIGPNGPMKVRNPLYSYKFKPEDLYTTFPFPFYQWPETLRHPTSNAPDAKTDVKAFIQTIADNSSQIRTKVYRCLSLLHDWPHFSNHTTVPEPNMADSLETIHDTMHYEIGGLQGTYGPATGHVGDPSVAGLDAVFWLHHTNVDRLLELWKTLNPEVWVTPGEQPGGTYTVPIDGTLDVNSDLTPFWNTQSSYWKSSELHRDPSIFNYSYPDYNGLYTLPTEERRRIIIQKINQLYRPQYAIPPHHRGSEYREWSLHIKFRKYELGAPFTVLVYLGEVYVGTVTAFVPSRETKCENCRRNAGAEIEGFVHLSEVLLKEHPDLPSTGDADVLPILKKDLKFEIAGSKPDGTALDIADLTSLKIAPACYSYKEGADDELPTIGEPEYHWGVLHGKPGNTPAEKWAV
ncbi:Di-copper centre-containing protein [Obba rivulosa]|uniref:tyrosinase n=1 Tax=Obba rivulosa TaxID=1052685 RepID=A0A8E2AKR6_9APHY|nr:Di-copper centre-containing protein [Obba rivulosa]